MPQKNHPRPQISESNLRRQLRLHYSLEGALRELPSERDRNFQLTTTDDITYVCKIASSADSYELLTMQNQAMLHVQQTAPELCPRPIPNQRGEFISILTENGRTHHLRLLTYLPGTLFAHAGPHDQTFLYDFGRALAQLDLALQSFTHPASVRSFVWDMRNAANLAGYTNFFADERDRALIIALIAGIEAEILIPMRSLRTQVVHYDANDYNVVWQDGRFAFIDFGDMLHTALITELAIGAAYALLDKPDPLAAISLVTRGYHEILPLQEAEIALLFPLVRLRLCMSVILAAYQRRQEPDNAYLSISEKAAWTALHQLAAIDPAFAHATLRHACTRHPTHQRTNAPSNQRTIPDLLTLRARLLGPNLSLSYNEPLKIVRGEGAYLYAEDGRAYLDAVNNVPHVGHCHPHVVAAAHRQNQRLNTNTRYLHDLIITYAARLTATLPNRLSVCYFVCSGSEANELALRLARAHTGAHDLLVIDGGYHGNTGELVNISPYKFKGKGGRGAPDYVHVVEMPDPYRGRFTGYGVASGARYAADVARVLAEMQGDGRPPAAFIAEPLLGCGGQIVLPDGYFAAAYDHVRSAGGVCIADEVQIGFGRVGSHFWGFETQGVVPDIVTMGKPIGNGHPLAAVVTTPEIAASFDNGMEYFNTFGGNPVSCAVGLAVLDVIAAENLQQNAWDVGQTLLADLQKLANDHPLIGDVRGLGLYVGVELVRDRQTKEPAATEASAIANEMKNRGILISTDGPLHNVLKIKPPLVFSHTQAEQLTQTLRQILIDWGW